MIGFVPLASTWLSRKAVPPKAKLFLPHHSSAIRFPKERLLPIVAMHVWVVNEFPETQIPQRSVLLEN